MGNAVTKSNANMRNGAGIFYSVVKTLPAGTEVAITGKELGWFKCQGGGASGYITDTLLQVTDPQVAERYNPIKQNYQKLATYTTKFTASDVNRNHNIELSAHKNSVIVKSGTSFSFNTNTGNSTKTANGWRESIILVNSERVKGVGGGICQCSSTIYSAVKQVAGLKILERHPHSIPVGYVPVSGEAMVNYGTSDFRFRNDNSYDIFVHVTVDHTIVSLTAAAYKINAVKPPAPVTPQKPKVIINGVPLPTYVEPMIIDDRIYIEVRHLFERLGYTVSYDSKTNIMRMTRGNEQFTLEKGANSKEIVCIQGGKKTVVPITFPIKIISGNTMFSLRIAGELAGYNISWDAKTYTATLSNKK